MLTLLVFGACAPATLLITAIDPAELADASGSAFTDTGEPDTAEPAGETNLTVIPLEVHTDAADTLADIIGDADGAFGLLADGRMVDLTTDDSLPADTEITGNVGKFWLPDGDAGFCAHVHQSTFVADATELACWNWGGELANQWAPGTAVGYGSAAARNPLNGERYVLESGSADLGAQVWEGGTLTLGEWSEEGPYGTSMAVFDGRIWIAANHDIIELSTDGSQIASVTSTVTRGASELSAPAAQTEAELTVEDGALFFSGWLGGSLRLESDGTWSDVSVLPAGQDMSYWPRELRTGEVYMTSTKGAIGALDGSWSGVVPGAETCDGEQALRTWPVDPTAGEFLWACRGTTTWGRAQIVVAEI